jgi:hypothetical protein
VTVNQRHAVLAGECPSSKVFVVAEGAVEVFCDRGLAPPSAPHVHGGSLLVGFAVVDVKWAEPA